MRTIVALLVLLPLSGAALSVGMGRSRTAQRVIGLAAIVSEVALAVVLLFAVDRDGPVVTQAGGWDAPVGITLVADRLAALLMTAAAVVLLGVLVYSIAERDAEGDSRAFHPLYLVLTSGMALSFLTGDLFNLFVAFEVVLISSFVLITLGGTAEQVRRGITYVVLNLVASTLFLFLLAFVYASTGTVNMADLAGKVPDLPDGLRAGLAVMLVVVFGMKAAVFPLFNWLPDSYPTAPTPVTAVFAGLLTKVGVYALIRTTTLVLPESSRPGPLLLWVAALTMVIGVLGAVAQSEIKRLLSFHVVSQIGYMIMGLALYTVAGVAAAIFFVVHQMFVKPALFLVSGALERRGARPGRWTAALFLVAALSLAGIPPSSGFVAKLALVQAGLAADQYAVVAASLAVSLFTLFSMTKIWTTAFWGASWEAEKPDRASAGTALLVVAALAVAVGAGPLYAYCERAAADLLQPTAYLAEVLVR